MMQQFKKLSPIALRKETEQNYEPLIWQPNWNCFCCQDTGIARNAASFFIEGYEHGKHLFPVCQNPGCQAGKLFGQSPSVQYSLDWRLNEYMCQQVDLEMRKIWREWAKEKQERKQKVDIDLSIIGKSLNKRSRTSQEEMEVKRRHEDTIEQ